MNLTVGIEKSKLDEILNENKALKKEIEQLKSSINSFQKKFNKIRRKFTLDDVKEIIRLYETGDYSQYDIAKKYNVSQTAIYKILKEHKNNGAY